VFVSHEAKLWVPTAVRIFALFLLGIAFFAAGLGLDMPQSLAGGATRRGASSMMRATYTAITPVRRLALRRSPAAIAAFAHKIRLEALRHQRRHRNGSRRAGSNSLDSSRAT
jgi:hypothetical protein